MVGGNDNDIEGGRASVLSRCDNEGRSENTGNVSFAPDVDRMDDGQQERGRQSGGGRASFDRTSVLTQQRERYKSSKISTVNQDGLIREQVAQVSPLRHLGC